MTSRERILNAAIPVFARKGRHGAHMEEIAALAHINKAMIYYIFHNKDDLYLEVLKFVLAKARESLAFATYEDIKNEKSYEEVISNYISRQLSFFLENMNYTKIMIDAMSNGAEEIAVTMKYIKELERDNNTTIIFKSFIEKGKSEKRIRDIDTDQLVISMVGMVIIYFLSHSITEVFEIEVIDEAQFMEERKRSVIDLIMNGIMVSFQEETQIKKNKAS